MSKQALLYDKLDNKSVRCRLCAHNCKIAESKFGICGVRQNIKGELYTLVYGEAAAAHIDPIEKKPLYHFLPGSRAFSIATIGCNFKCGFCQNWQISQASKSRQDVFSGEQLMPEQIVSQAKKSNCLSISYTYTEPTIFFEYAFDTAKLAKQAGLANNFITNGYMTKQALDMIRPYLDAANVDLKSFSNEYYKNNCKALLQPVLDSIAYMKKLGIWVEVTTLIIPGENDSQQELTAIAKFIADLDKDIPWHISRFHPDYQFTDYSATPVDTLRKARQIGKQEGLRYIYLGNVLEGSDTYCYNCNELLIKRSYFNTERNNIKKGRCPVCSAEISGIWSRPGQG
jgi:pyruvate formate lyase activating enzyme